MKYKLVILIISGLVFSCINQPLKINVTTEEDAPQIKYGIDQLMQVEDIQDFYLTGGVNVDVSIDAEHLGAEAFEISSLARDVKIVGGDPAGAMYGLLDFKEQNSFELIPGEVIGENPLNILNGVISGNGL